jgi:hypothetical protein
MFTGLLLLGISLGWTNDSVGGRRMYFRQLFELQLFPDGNALSVSE